MTYRCLRWAIFTLALIAFMGTTPWAAHRVSGTLTRTYVIVTDTDLVGLPRRYRARATRDVICDVGSSPCFSFGASGVELRLNGFT